MMIQNAPYGRGESKKGYLLLCSSTSYNITTMQFSELANELTNCSRCCRDKYTITFLRGANLKESCISSKSRHACANIHSFKIIIMKQRKTFERMEKSHVGISSFPAETNKAIYGHTQMRLSSA